MPEPTRAYFEPRFGRDFRQVRVHSGGQAAQTARSIHARAYAVENDIVFGPGQYDLTSGSGQRLLAHELTHVLQQRAGRAGRSIQTAKSDESAEASYDIGDTIATLNFVLAVAGATLADPELDLARRVKIERQAEKLRPLSGKLESARSTDGAGVEFGFDTDPKKNEVEAGDAERTLEDLFAGSDALPEGKAGPSTGEGGEPPTLQAAAVSGGLQITPLLVPQVQRCEAVCIGVIVLAGLLLAGCTDKSKGKTVDPKDKRTKPCDEKEKGTIKKFHDEGLKWVKEAASKLDGFRSGKASEGDRAIVEKALNDNFHTTDATAAKKIVGNLDRIKKHMEGSSYRYKCICREGGEAFSLGTQVHLCPRWFRKIATDHIRNTTTIIHEMGHGIGLSGSLPISTGKVEDIYEFHSGYKTMKPEVAMKNPDPFAVFARQVFYKGGHPPGTHK